MTSLINTCRNFSCQEFCGAYKTEFKKDNAQHILLIIAIASYILFCVGWNLCKANNINLIEGVTYSNPHLFAWIAMVGVLGMVIPIAGAFILKIAKTCDRMNRCVIAQAVNQNGHVENT